MLDFNDILSTLDDNDRLNERRETRRHQSLNKSLDHGFDIPDPKVDVLGEIIRREQIIELKVALLQLTKKQRFVVLSYALDEQSFREIGDKLEISKETAREHFTAAIKKLKNILS